jgi:hypothetical protein
MKMKKLFLAVAICLFISSAALAQEKPQQPEPKPVEVPKLTQGTAQPAPEPRLVQLSAEQQSPFLNLIKERDEVYQQYQLRLEGAWIMLKLLLGLEPECQLEPTPDNKLRVKCPAKPEAKPKP